MACLLSFAVPSSARRRILVDDPAATAVEHSPSNDRGPRPTAHYQEIIGINQLYG